MPYIIGSLGPEALKYESFEGKGKLQTLNPKPQNLNPLWWFPSNLKPPEVRSGTERFSWWLGTLGFYSYGFRIVGFGGLGFRV